MQHCQPLHWKQNYDKRHKCRQVIGGRTEPTFITGRPSISCEGTGMRPSAVLKLDCDCTDRLDGGRRSVCGGEDIGLADMVGFWPSLCLLWPVLAVLLEVVREAGRRAKGFFCAWFRSRSWADQRRASGQQHLSCLSVGEPIGSQKLLCSPELLCYRRTVDASRWIRLKFGRIWEAAKRA